MPFREPQHYVNNLQPGALVEFQGRPIGRVEGVVPQVDGVHILRVIAALDAPHSRLVTLPHEWIRIAAPVDRAPRAGGRHPLRLAANLAGREGRVAGRGWPTRPDGRRRGGWLASPPGGPRRGAGAADAGRACLRRVRGAGRTCEGRAPARFPPGTTPRPRRLRAAHRHPKQQPQRGAPRRAQRAPGEVGVGAPEAAGALRRRAPIPRS
jgi:hypothetical protein